MKEVDIKVNGQPMKTELSTYMDGALSFSIHKLDVHSLKVTSSSEDHMVDAVKSEKAAGTKATCRMGSSMARAHYLTVSKSTKAASKTM